MRKALHFFLVLLPLGCLAEAAGLERSFWLHASLAADTRRGYWGPEFPAGAAATDQEMGRAARWLTVTGAANRLYLVYHREVPPDDIERVFRAWRVHTPASTELVPTLVLRGYDRWTTPVFQPGEVGRLATFFLHALRATNAAVYDVYANRDQGDGLQELSRVYTNGLIRVGIQPDETLAAPFVSAVGDTWSAFCHGNSDERWRQDDAGLPTLRRWVEIRNRGDRPVAWDLIAVAWDYAATADGRHPGYDDAARNAPLPFGRNKRAVAEIVRIARADRLAGFSSDLCILEANAKHPARDGATNSLYACLRRGVEYRGVFAQPFMEITGIFASLRDEAVKASPPP